MSSGRPPGPWFVTRETTLQPVDAFRPGKGRYKQVMVPAAEPNLGPEFTPDRALAALREAAPRLAGTLPVGRPLENVRAYILDRRQRAVPVGVGGELYLGGAGVSRGLRRQSNFYIITYGTSKLLIVNEDATTSTLALSRQN